MYRNVISTLIVLTLTFHHHSSIWKIQQKNTIIYWCIFRITSARTFPAHRHTANRSTTSHRTRCANHMYFISNSTTNEVSWTCTLLEHSFFSLLFVFFVSFFCCCCYVYVIIFVFYASLTKESNYNRNIPLVVAMLYIAIALCVD